MAVEMYTQFKELAKQLFLGHNPDQPDPWHATWAEHVLTVCTQGVHSYEVFKSFPTDPHVRHLLFMRYQDIEGMCYSTRSDTECILIERLPCMTLSEMNTLPSSATEGSIGVESATSGTHSLANTQSNISNTPQPSAPTLADAPSYISNSSELSAPTIVSATKESITVAAGQDSSARRYNT